MSRGWLLYSISALLLGIILIRLFQIQVLEHDKYSFLALNNSSKLSITRAPRGIIYDRNNEILASNKQSLNLIAYPGLLRDEVQKQESAKVLSKIIKKSEKEIYELIKDINPTEPLSKIIKKDLNLDEAIQIYEKYSELPGISVEKQAIRFYPYKEIAGHILGYVGQASTKDLEKSRSLYSNSEKKLNIGDVVGKEGLEKVFDKKLRGINGEEWFPVDRVGRSQSQTREAEVYEKKAQKGEDLGLTIDIELQSVAEKAMGSMAGAAVAINPQNGEILALVSKPGYDPNLFTKALSTRAFNELNRKKAFLNRAISAYTPGSIWKPISALAALENGVISRYQKFKVSDSIDLKGFRYGDWTEKEGIMGLSEAIAWSRDTYFYQMAKSMKPEWIAELGKKLGAGRKTKIELLGEARGIVPSPEWKRRTLKQQWFPGNTLHFSIGQSFLLTTPLQAAKWISAIAMNGLVPRPHIVKNLKKEKPEREIELAKENLEVVKKGMLDCVEKGTCAASRIKGIKIAGKTGSAEVHGYKHSTHGWFVAFAPAGKDSNGNEQIPEIVIVVFGEGAGHGGTVAAPVARKIFKHYFSKNPEEI